MAKSLISALLLASSLALLASPMVSAEVVEHSLYIKNLTVNHLCNDQIVTSANESVPGPTISVHEGDTLVVHVLNQSPYNISIHWHGIFQLLSGWADGPEYVTQCPIRPGHNYTYKFNITGQEGTLWWHAHTSWLRATVHGALIIYPRSNPLKPHPYPFPTPYKEVPIILGEWWNANVVDVENEAIISGGVPNNSNAFTINGKVGDFYPCSKHDIYRLKVVPGQSYLLRIINAALNNQLFFKIANHKLTVVAVDATYTKPYDTDVVVIAPGQTTDVLFTANQPVGSYYIAAQPYISAVGVPFDDTTARGIIVYHGSTSSTPVKAVLPAFNDTPTAHKFFTNLTGLVGGPHWVPVPPRVDKHMFITVGLNLDFCKSGNATCAGPFGQRFSASMSNQSFVFPHTLSMLQAFHFGVSGIYTTDFPDAPPVFDYTNTSLSFNQLLLFATKGTKVTKLKYNQVVEIVLQNTALIGIENHPIHLHGFNFHVLAQGFGNYNSGRDAKKFNLINPQIRNTIAVPTGGWAVIRFQANNPGIWLMHCHLDVHLPWGLATAFEIENGPTKSSTLPPPPVDLPKC
ncbi:Laccase [Parasponia andersonii]|uniref:Laccase n=1 Tax=Parasponia andersonii TaxID=3476 RepID=A0A2P5AKN6_PARAD|nr:Laccase [Parasponia andersonii]